MRHPSRDTQLQHPSSKNTGRRFLFLRIIQTQNHNDRAALVPRESPIVSQLMWQFRKLLRGVIRSTSSKYGITAQIGERKDSLLFAGRSIPEFVTG